MEYILTDMNGEEATFNDLDYLDSFLRNPYEMWEKGAGDSAIEISKQERLIFFKVEKGIFIMQHPVYIAPLIDKARIGTITHYVGGEAMIINSKFLCDESQALKY